VPSHPPKFTTLAGFDQCRAQVEQGLSGTGFSLLGLNSQRRGPELSQQNSTDGSLFHKHGNLFHKHRLPFHKFGTRESRARCLGIRTPLLHACNHSSLAKEVTEPCTTGRLSRGNNRLRCFLCVSRCNRRLRHPGSKNQNLQVGWERKANYREGLTKIRSQSRPGIHPDGQLIELCLVLRIPNLHQRSEY
jgi:hypothetical protein